MHRQDPSIMFRLADLARRASMAGPQAVVIEIGPPSDRRVTIRTLDNHRLVGQATERVLAYARHGVLTIVA